MARFTKEMVDSYADKLLIGLTPEENKMVLDEFEVIDNDIDVINTINKLVLYSTLLVIISITTVIIAGIININPPIVGMPCFSLCSFFKNLSSRDFFS